MKFKFLNKTDVPMGYNRQKLEMKKIVIVLIAMIGFAFAAKAQSCDVGEGTYVSVNPSVSNGKICCTAYCYGDAKPTSGTVYATVYYIDKNGNEGSEMISIRWTSVDSDNQLRMRGGSDELHWYGYHTNVEMITKWEVSAGACRIERKE